MTIRRRIEEAAALRQAGLDEAAFILLLIAIAAASRRKYPEKRKKPGGPGLFDGEAFEAYLEQRIKECMPGGYPGDSGFLGIAYNGSSVSISRALYTEFRCGLIHAAEPVRGARLDSSSADMTISVSSDELVLGAGWLELLFRVVIEDRELKPMFDDIRPRAEHDLIYVGEGNQDEFQQTFQDYHRLSKGRLVLLKTFIAKVGRDRLDAMDDRDVRSFWAQDVVGSPESFGLNEGSIGALAVAAPQYYELDPANERTFLRGRHVITDEGMSILRELLANYR